MISNEKTTRKSVFTVSKLTSEIKVLLEENYPIIWITGELTNFRKPGSGHFYFSLKDDHAQINAVMFKGQNKNLSFTPEDGLQITGLGRISVYEPRGTYQIILEHMEPRGTGALQIAFEQLKKRLSDEGIFDEAHKTRIPFLPSKISIITSGSGAVLHDIMNVVNRRFPGMNLEIIPVRVQGYGSELEISGALSVVSSRKESDVIILARGGGSLEDLHAFNSEDVARAIFFSEIPVISAVGHETDFTISDFAADLRAPTPSAAAELAVPEKNVLKKQIAHLNENLLVVFQNYIQNKRSQLSEFDRKIVDPTKKIQDMRLKTDDLLARIARNVLYAFQKEKSRLNVYNSRFNISNHLNKINNYKQLISKTSHNLLMALESYLTEYRARINGFSSQINAMNPEAVLQRGYSITRTVPEKTIIKDAESVSRGQHIETLLANGILKSKVEGKLPDVKKDV